MDTEQFEKQFAEIESYDSNSYGSAAAKHVRTALTLIKGLIGRINELEQAKDHWEAANFGTDDCDTVSNDTVCRDQSAELELLLDKITGIANGLTTGSVGSSKVKIIGTVKELKSKIFN